MPQRRHIFTFPALVIWLIAVAAAPPWLQAADEPVPIEDIAKIRAIGLDSDRSEALRLARTLSDTYGPRLTGAPNTQRAGEWTVAEMRRWGLDDARLEPWPASTPSAAFPRGWVNEETTIAAVAPQAFPIHGTPVAWTPGTKGRMRGKVVLAPDLAPDDVRGKYAGQVKGKWILGSRVPDVRPFFQPVARRYTTEDLDRMEARGRTQGPGRAARQAGPAPPLGATAPNAPPAAPFDRYAFFKSEGALGIITTSAIGHGVYTIGGSNRQADPKTLLPVIVISAEDYGRLARLAEGSTPVIVEATIRNRDIPNPPMFNVIGELRGTDKADEVVMIGGHLDSWHAATGATDNAAGVAAVLEAMRILKASGIRLRRTVRVGLWTGEEQGLYRSALYVRQHFGGARPSRGAEPAAITPEHARFAAYFNLDEGTGAIRGLYLQQNAAAEPVFRAWIAPLADLGVTHLTLSSTGGSDHISFDAAGLPGWHFIQDEIEYNTLTHHTNLDTAERFVPEDLRKNATIVAVFAMLAANREERMPRK